MKIKIPVIGVPNYPWKKKVIKFARNNPYIVKLEVEDLCYECERHRELLRMFDNGLTCYSDSSYFHYSITMSKKTKEVALKKISKFKILYENMKKGVYECPENRLPIVTEDGCRLDGSHKLTILDHIGCKETDVNIFIYNKLFSKKERKKIIIDNLNFRKEMYNL
jgi:hypothetical protein